MRYLMNTGAEAERVRERWVVTWHHSRGGTSSIKSEAAVGGCSCLPLGDKLKSRRDSPRYVRVYCTCRCGCREGVGEAREMRNGILWPGVAGEGRDRPRSAGYRREGPRLTEIYPRLCDYSRVTGQKQRQRERERWEEGGRSGAGRSGAAARRRGRWRVVAARREASGAN